MDIRNVAIIAHVDHGKTTLVDKLISYTKALGRDSQSGNLDTNELERERGITILSKNVSMHYAGCKINIIDTPGHADFGGEVERVLNMADGVLLVVDAFEGTMPQTRFVLQKALELGLKPIVVINKVDKPNCRPELVQEQVFDLMFSLGATEDQLNFPTLYGSAKQEWMSTSASVKTDNIEPLLKAIVEYIPAPKVEEGSVQLLITSIEYSKYVGRIAVGKLRRGVLRKDMPIMLSMRDGSLRKLQLKDLCVFEGLTKTPVEEVQAGDICALVGLEGFEIGGTVCDVNNPEPLPVLKVDEPTMSMLFTINNSPFFGRDGKFVTSRHLRERLERELEWNLALRVEPGPSADAFIVYGRGILHLSILIETMRREGYELQVGQPQVVIKEIDGKKCEPIEVMRVDLPTEMSGKAIELATQRKGTLISMQEAEDRTHIEFEIPSRGLIGLRSQLLTATNGEAIMTHLLKGFEPYRGEIEARTNGSLIALESGKAIPYAVGKLQDRGVFFIDPPEDVYAGEIVGENTRGNDITVNVCKEKKLSNMRASGSDEKIILAPPVKFSLEEALEYIRDDEYVEITPNAMRLRKIELDETARKRQQRN
ncbi:MAG: translational GTPase TypA [Bacteroides sp.]|mgnify:FL=1